MLPLSLGSIGFLAFVGIAAASTAKSETTVVSSEIGGESTSFAAYLTELPTDSRATYGNEGAVTTSVSSRNSSLASTNSTTSPSVVPTTPSATRTYLSGTNSRSTSYPTNAAKCNGFAELCGRKYSNVTYVVAHNSPFHIANNAASNQDYDVITQLNDGIRGIQSETHYVNDTVMLCHTSCSELNAGPLEEYLTKVRHWLELDINRNEIITVILGNEDFIKPTNYIAPVTNSGILPYLYTPPTQPMDLDHWPTLGDMILANTRVVMMLAYEANQTAVPWLLDMWSYQWQTPFSPTNVSFPCTVQRPPNQAHEVSEKRLMLANHNLNVQLDDPHLQLDILIPNTAVINNTNANTTDLGAAKRTIDQCSEAWGRPPNYVLVDYYNRGNFEGSALAAAAEANGVSYDVNSCCGHKEESGASVRTSLMQTSFLYGLLGLLAVILLDC